MTLDRGPGVTTALRRLGALAEWHRQLREGVDGQRAEDSSTWRRGPLYYAAIYETQAFEALAQGLPSHALDYMAKAVAELKRATNDPKIAA